MIEEAASAKAADFASLSQIVLESCIAQTDNRTGYMKRLLSDSYQYQAIARIDINMTDALSQCQAWLRMIVERLAESNESKDALELASAYVEIGRAHMRKDMQHEALESWKQAYHVFDNADDEKKLELSWPCIHLGLLYALRGEGFRGDDLLLPALQNREKALGTDDKTSFV